MKSDWAILSVAAIAIVGTISWCSYDTYRSVQEQKRYNLIRHLDDVLEFKQNDNLARVSGTVVEYHGTRMIPVSFVKTKKRIVVPTGDHNPKDGEIWEIKLNGTSYDISSYEFVKLVELKNET